jgi:uncharacterized protein (DUF2267 family)
MDYDEMVSAVARRARLDRDRAAIALAATLEVLGERIGRGEREDLASQLPFEVKNLVLQDRAKGQRMSLREFLSRIAEREATSPREARVHASAVFRTLRDAVGDGEMNDVFAQLPPDYRMLLFPPPQPVPTGAPPTG